MAVAAEIMAIDRPTFRKVLGSFAAGVTVISTVGDDGAPYGLTATAFTSVSLDPPLVLICVDKKAESHPHLLWAQKFTVSLLRREQEDVSNRFAKSGGDKFQGISTRHGGNGVPHIVGALGYLECKTTQVLEAGDHTVFIGEVEAADAFDGDPLLYFRGAYRGVTS